ncbi:MAG: ABC transporter ATP-binding protein [Candidatus Njordarchaeia archaeon]
MSKRLGGSLVLRDVSFSVGRREIFMINGPSGSGKSTLLRCLNRLIEPDGGEIIFDGVNIKEMDVLELRRKMGFVSQVPAMFEGTVRDNLLYALKVHKIDVGEEELANKIVGVGLPRDYLDKPAHELSVGEQQRVSIARALLLKPKLLLMDEPTSHLDPDNTRLVEELVLRLRDREGISFVIVSHSPEQSRRIGDKIAFLENGTISRVEVNEK